MLKWNIVDVLGNNSQTWTTNLLVNISHVSFVATKMRNSIDKLNQLYLFKGPLHIFLINRCSFAHFIQSEGGVDVVSDEFDDSLSPPGKIGLFSHIRQRFFRSSDFLFKQTQLVTESNQELSVALPLMERQNQNARKVVIRLFFLN